MIQKYKALIYTTIHAYNIKNKDDAYIEALYSLLDCIKLYKDNVGAPFYSYYSKALKRKMLKIAKDEYEDKKYLVYMKEELCPSFYEEKKEYMASFNNELKDLVYDEIFLKNCSIKHFCIKYNIETKKVYNVIYSIKQDLKNKIKG